MTSKTYSALLIALTLWAVVSPLSTYNTFAMFGVVESQLVPIQLSITVLMILFAMIAGRYFGKHCARNPSVTKRMRRIWIVGFYVIGPPVLYIYYRRYCYIAPSNSPFLEGIEAA